MASACIPSFPSLFLVLGGWGGQVHTAPTYMKWMLLFEEPNTKTVWVGKALPREWLGAGVEPVVVSNATTRYGRVSYTMSADTDTAADTAAPFTVTASVSLPATFAGPAGPAGGVRVRVRWPPWTPRRGVLGSLMPRRHPCRCQPCCAVGHA